MMKPILVALGTLTLSASAFSQIEYSAFTLTGKGVATTFATDYQAIGINPANLGFNTSYENKHVSFGMNEFAYSIHSDVFGRQSLRDQVTSLIKKDTSDAFTYDEKMQLANDVANTGLSMNFDMMSLGFAYQNEKLGGFAFKINDNAHFYSKLGNTAAELLFLGKTAPYFDSLMYIDPNTLDTTMVANYQNINPDSLQNMIGIAGAPQLLKDLIKGTDINAYWTREYNLSYGRKIIEKEGKVALFAGAGIKFIQGMGYVDLKSDDNGNLTAFSSLSSKFGIDYGAAATSNPTARPGDTTGLLPKPVGKGWGFDFGASALLFDKLTIGVAMTNIGSITWDGNVYTINDSTILATTTASGIDNYTMASSNDLGQVVGQEGIFTWGGEQSKTIKLPTTIRAGASFKIGEIANIGMDMVIPGNTLPGSLDRSYFSIGGDIKPAPWVMLNAGITAVGNNGFAIPMGVTFIAGKGSWEAGIASRDLHSFIAKNGATLSFSAGFMRFRF